MWFIDKGFADYRTVFQHILQIDQIAVVHMLRKIIGVMEMNQPFLIRFHNIRRQQQSFRQIPADLTGHIIPLYAVNHRILIRVLLHNFFVIAFDQRQNPPVRRIALADKGTGIAIPHITPRHIKGPLCHNLVLHHVLHLFHRDSPVHPVTFKMYIFRQLLNLLLRQFLTHRSLIRLLHRGLNFGNIKIHFRAVAFDYLHSSTSSSPLCPCLSAVCRRAAGFYYYIPLFL